MAPRSSASARRSREQLEFIPAKLRVLRHVRPKYACKTCRTGIHTAPLPPQPIPKSLASPTLLAHIAVSKYADGLPLYRQETMFRRLGIDLPRASLANWMVKTGELVQPLVNLLRDDLLASGFVQCDETRYQVLKEPGKAATSQSYLWVQRSEDVVLYDYDASRSAEVPKRLLAGFEGCSPDRRLRGLRRHRPGARHHARGVLGARAAQVRRGPEGAEERARRRNARSRRAGRSKGSASSRSSTRSSARSRRSPRTSAYRIRQERSRPVDGEAAGLAHRIDSLAYRRRASPGKALAYLDGQWPKLIRVLDHESGARSTPTGVENAIRPFVVGRKNWLFADTVRGAQASANLYSLIETAKCNGVEPFAYLRLVLAKLPGATTLNEVEALLPRHVAPENLQDASRFSTTD